MTVPTDRKKVEASQIRGILMKACSGYFQEMHKGLMSIGSDPDKVAERAVEGVEEATTKLLAMLEGARVDELEHRISNLAYADGYCNSRSGFIKNELVSAKRKLAALRKGQV